MFRRWNRRWMLLGATVVVVLACASVAYALTSADFEPRANEWQGSTCNEALLKGKASAANNQKIAVCFAVAKVKEQQASISSLQTAVAKIEASQAPPPLNFTFFNATPINKAPVVSPIVDAEKYKGITVSTQASPAAGTVTLEVSNDQSTWITAQGLTSSAQSVPVSITGRYYRLTATPGAGSTSITSFAHLAP